MATGSYLLVLRVCTVSAVEKLTNRTEPEAHHERTSTAPRPYHERTSTARPHHEHTPRPYHERTPRPYLDRTTSVLYLDRTRTVPRAYLDRTRTVPRAYLDRTTSVPRPHQDLPRAYLDRTTSVPRPHHERTSYLDGTTNRTSTASAYSTSTAPRAYALTILYKSLQYLVMNA